MLHCLPTGSSHEVQPIDLQDTYIKPVLPPATTIRNFSRKSNPTTTRNRTFPRSNFVNVQNLSEGLNSPGTGKPSYPE